jgi:hypothetical protein
LVSQSPSLALTAGVLMAATVGAGVGNVCIAYLLQRVVPSSVLGRVFAPMGTLSSCTFGLSPLVAGALLGVVPARAGPVHRPLDRRRGPRRGPHHGAHAAACASLSTWARPRSGTPAVTRSWCFGFVNNQR